MNEQVYRCATGNGEELRVRRLRIEGYQHRATLIIEAHEEATASTNSVWLGLKDLKALRKQLKKIIKELEDG